jgi:hypothetical protein
MVCDDMLISDRLRDIFYREANREAGLGTVSNYKCIKKNIMR